METQPPAVRRRLAFVLAGLGLTLALGGAAAWYFGFQPDVPPPETAPAAPPDPRLTFATPFKNVHPDVKYVGDAKCAACHPAVTHSFHQHPMGRSAAVGEGATRIEKYDTTAHNPVRTTAHTLTVQERAGGVRHTLTGNAPETAGITYETAVDLVIGSGTRGRSYLTIDRGGTDSTDPNRGSLWQSPISWFTDDGRWNVSPGFNLGGGGRREVAAECLYCHVNRTDPVPHSTNLYTQVIVGPQAAIGCERCHGPGELHVRKQSDTPTAAGRDDTVVNPKHLTADLQLDVCRQCHMLGTERVVRRGRDLFEFRPGLPLDLFLSVFVQPPEQADGQQSVGQFEQLDQSGCFTKSGGAMTCTTCHDPHKAPAKGEAAAFFRAKCLTCHDTKGCSQPEVVRLEKADSCTACHMPRRGSTSIVHASVTDHRIPRRAADPPKPTPGSPAGGPSLVAYRPGPHAPPADERDRDLGVALALHPPDQDPTAATKKLKAAVARWPDDATAWLTLSATLRDPDGQLAAVRRAADLRPDSEDVLASWAATETSVGSYQIALDVTDRLIRMNPTALAHRLRRVNVLMAMRDWAAAERACQDALAVNPLSSPVRLMRARALTAMGRTADADKEADVVIALQSDPQVQQQLRKMLRAR